LLGKFAGRPFWSLVRKYIIKDVDILYKGILSLEKEYKQIGYSVLDLKYHGIASIVNDLFFKKLSRGIIEPFSKDEYREWKECYKGGFVELIDLNLKQEKFMCTTSMGCTLMS
jgi:hypothetical protein